MIKFEKKLNAVMLSNPQIERPLRYDKAYSYISKSDRDAYEFENLHLEDSTDMYNLLDSSLVE